MEMQPQAESYAWVGWQSAIAILGLSDLKILVKKAFDWGFIDSVQRQLSWPVVLPHRRMFPSHRALPHHVCSRCLIALRPNPSSFSAF
jgi:hypothetical protein